MCRINKLCPHCGAIGQVELEYDDGWQVNCLQCSCVIPILETELPTGLSKHHFEGICLQSTMEARTIYNVGSGIYPPKRIWGGHLGEIND